MLNILSILTFVHDGVMNKHERFHIANDEHIKDTKTGVEIHLYDDWFKLTREDETIVKMSDFTVPEQDVMWKIKQLIVDPETAREREENHEKYLLERRQSLSQYYENPVAVTDDIVKPESDTTEYVG